jgi:hypothetical protein
MKMGVFCCLDAQNGLTFTGTARRRFSPLSAGSSVLDAWLGDGAHQSAMSDRCTLHHKNHRTDILTADRKSLDRA